MVHTKRCMNAFLQAIENNERYITDFFLHRDYLGEENQK